MEPSWIGWQGEKPVPNPIDFRLPHRTAVLLPPDPCTASLLAQRSLEALLSTVPTPFSFVTAPPAMYPCRPLPEGEAADFL